MINFKLFLIDFILLFLIGEIYPKIKWNRFNCNQRDLDDTNNFKVLAFVMQDNWLFLYFKKMVVKMRKLNFGQFKERIELDNKEEYFLYTYGHIYNHLYQTDQVPPIASKGIMIGSIILEKENSKSETYVWYEGEQDESIYPFLIVNDSDFVGVLRSQKDFKKNIILNSKLDKRFRYDYVYVIDNRYKRLEIGFSKLLFLIHFALQFKNSKKLITNLTYNFPEQEFVSFLQATLSKEKLINPLVFYDIDNYDNNEFTMILIRFPWTINDVLIEINLFIHPSYKHLQKHMKPLIIWQPNETLNITLKELFNCHQRLNDIKMREFKGILYSIDYKWFYIFIDNFYFLSKDNENFLNYNNEQFNDNSMTVHSIESKDFNDEIIFEKLNLKYVKSLYKDNYLAFNLNESFNLTFQADDQNPLLISKEETKQVNQCLKNILAIDDIIFCFEEKFYYLVSLDNFETFIDKIVKRPIYEIFLSNDDYLNDIYRNERFQIIFNYNPDSNGRSYTHYVLISENFRISIKKSMLLAKQTELDQNDEYTENDFWIELNKDYRELDLYLEYNCLFKTKKQCEDFSLKFEIPTSPTYHPPMRNIFSTSTNWLTSNEDYLTRPEKTTIKDEEQATSERQLINEKETDEIKKNSKNENNKNTFEQIKLISWIFIVLMITVFCLTFILILLKFDQKSTKKKVFDSRFDSFIKKLSKSSNTNLSTKTDQSTKIDRSTNKKRYTNKNRFTKTNLSTKTNKSDLKSRPTIIHSE